MSSWRAPQPSKCSRSGMRWKITTTSRIFKRTSTSRRRLSKLPPSNGRQRDSETTRLRELQTSSHLEVAKSLSQVVLGIDPGLATTGWGVIEKTPTKLQLLSYGA